MAFSAENIYERLGAVLQTSGREMQFTREEGIASQGEIVRALIKVVTATTVTLAEIIGEMATEIEALRAEIDRKG